MAVISHYALLALSLARTLCGAYWMEVKVVRDNRKSLPPLPPVSGTTEEAMTETQSLARLLSIVAPWTATLTLAPGPISRPRITSRNG